jgi:hypothetical protein
LKVIRALVLSFLIALSCFLILEKSYAEEVDQELLNSLKIEASHNLNRLKSLNEEKKNNQIYDTEREKGLGLFFEEQESWELQREKGLAEYKKQKKDQSPQEGGPEYLADQKEKKRMAEKNEQSRRIQVRTRNQVLNENAGVISKLESQELGLDETRPRYDLRNRGKNKWNKNASGSMGRPSMGNSRPSFTPPPSSDMDSGFPPPPPPPAEYIPPPVMDNYDDIPPPPPPPPGYDYGSGVGTGIPYDSGYGDIPPPPSPPPGDYDF